MNEPNNTHKANSRARGPPDKRPGHPRTELRFARGWRCRPGKSFTSLEGRSPPRVRFRLARGLGTPSSGIPPRSGAGRPLERGLVSIESRALPRADFCLAQGYCRMDFPGPTTSVGTRTDYSVGPWDYPSCGTRHLMA
jgi:hypothetical protein